MLGEARRARRGIDRVNRDVVFTAREDLAPAELDAAARAVGKIDEAPVRMDVYGAGTLLRLRLLGRAQRRRHESRQGLETVPSHPVDMDLVLALDRYVHPRFLRMEIEVSRPETEAPGRRNGRGVGELAAAVIEDFQSAGILGTPGGGIVPAR